MDFLFYKRKKENQIQVLILILIYLSDAALISSDSYRNLLLLTKLWF